MLRSSEIKRRAGELGFSFCGVVPAVPSPTLDGYLTWIDAGMHGTMGYMARPDRVARRRDLRVILSGASSLIVVGLDYTTVGPPQEVLRDPLRGRIAMYAWGQDYHDVMGAALEQVAAELEHGTFGGIPATKWYVDTGAILERSHGQQAGFGFVGKNTMLIHPRRGSAFFLGVIVTDAQADRYDEPLAPSPGCGTCTRCLTACPTSAFPKPYVLDARLCISYLTIEHKGDIPSDVRPNMGNWVFGCDVCQDVCPWQRFAPITHVSAFAPDSHDRAAPLLIDLLTLDDAGFQRRFAGSPVERIDRARMVRNACIAAGEQRECHGRAAAAGACGWCRPADSRTCAVGTGAAQRMNCTSKCRKRHDRLWADNGPIRWSGKGTVR
ncbi:MAG: tRNA epoxyqueuosine(34) reductase QueG [Chloroflexi bacterium]|nr:tRNA epoxyqueuosine(34) reductase QueG [Chloroflexota bacterium]